MFESLGLSAEMLTVYEALLREPDRPVEDLPQMVQLGAETLTTALDGLRALNLVIPRWTDPENDQEYAIHPRDAFPALAKKRRAEVESSLTDIQQAEVSAEAWSQQYSSFLTQRRTGDVEILEGRERANLRMQQFQAKKSLWGLNTASADSFGAVGPPDQSPDREYLHRGIDFRMIYARPVWGSSAVQQYIDWLQSNGGKVRLAPSIPLRTMIFDGEAVVMPLVPGDHDAGAVVHHGPAVVALAIAAFEKYWQYAEPADAPGRSEGAGPTAQEAEFLNLLTEGATDAQAARRLGVSLRTIRRMAAGLSERLGASGRFELGVRAAQRGWVK